MYTYTYLRAARYFQGHGNSSIRLCLVRTLLWKTSGTPLSQKVIILSKVFKQRWIWMCVAVFRKFHALILGTGQTGISNWALTGHSMASSPAHAAMDNKPRCLSHQCCQGNLNFTPRTSKKWFSHRHRPTRRPSHGSGLAIIRKLLIVFSGPLASDNISLDFPTTSVSICLLWTKLSFVSICLPTQLMASSFLRSRILPENSFMATLNIWCNVRACSIRIQKFLVGHTNSNFGKTFVIEPLISSWLRPHRRTKGTETATDRESWPPCHSLPPCIQLDQDHLSAYVYLMHFILYQISLSSWWCFVVCDVFTYYL